MSHVSQAPRPVVAVGVIVFDELGGVLLVRRGQEPSIGRWSVPGGKVERGETLAAACARELLAETGLEVMLGALCEVAEYIDEAYHYVILDYVGTQPRGTLRAGEDAAEARFMPLAEAGQMETTAGLLPVLRKAARMLGW